MAAVVQRSTFILDRPGPSATFEELDSAKTSSYKDGRRPARKDAWTHKTAVSLETTGQLESESSCPIHRKQIATQSFRTRHYEAFSDGADRAD